jgi:hypothetical protein
MIHSPRLFWLSPSLQVLRRWYDNRMVFSGRQPTVYLDLMKDTTEVVCRFKDTCNAVPFAQQPEDIDPQQWIWDFQGQLMVVSKPFHEGCHWAKYLGEFLPTVIRLKELHDAGYVHGDIRCLNPIFPDGKRKHPGIAKDTDLFHLIDFDFGGKLNASPPLVYREGYRGSLIDGRRIGMRGKEITKWHD